MSVIIASKPNRGEGENLSPKTEKPVQPVRSNEQNKKRGKKEK